MADGLILNNLNWQPGQCLEVKGFIPKDSKTFAINLGQNNSNYLIHFNPRFNHEKDTNKIVCNSKKADVYGAEQRESSFPFQQGTETTVCFDYQTDKINIKLSSGKQFSFPVRLTLPCVSFLALRGLEYRSITIE
ncbi:galectin-1-like isoform 2-T2 [Anomaloglossus baeobatrachus]|uniref:galectin-1-like isoform X2 n=1 Tax=Anomaloglossus baeobatrachus TaxID=238106 RepID=UPI003F504AF1